jgi:hypothetical protein
MKETGNNMVLMPSIRETKDNLFRTNDDGLFNASSLAKEYGKDVYGYIRGQKVRDFVTGISLEYGLDPNREFSDRGSIVRVISGGTSPGTWMHLDIFIKFLGWLDPKLERDFLKSAFAANRKPDEDPLQKKLAGIEAEIAALKRKLARNPVYRELMQKEKGARLLRLEIEKGQKSMRKRMIEKLKDAQLTLPQAK